VRRLASGPEARGYRIARACGLSEGAARRRAADADAFRAALASPFRAGGPLTPWEVQVTTDQAISWVMRAVLTLAEDGPATDLCAAYMSTTHDHLRTSKAALDAGLAAFMDDHPDKVEIGRHAALVALQLAVSACAVLVEHPFLDHVDAPTTEALN